MSLPIPRSSYGTRRRSLMSLTRGPLSLAIKLALPVGERMGLSLARPSAHPKPWGGLIDVSVEQELKRTNDFLNQLVPSINSMRVEMQEELGKVREQITGIEKKD